MMKKPADMENVCVNAGPQHAGAPGGLGAMWQGEWPLRKAFWLALIAPQVMLNVMAWLLASASSDAEPVGTAPMVFLFLRLVALTVGAVAVWRSSRRTSHKACGLAARGLVVTMLVLIISVPVIGGISMTILRYQETGTEKPFDRVERNPER